jgi:cytoskeletal protein CcmA (bactofilin family)
MKTVLVALCLLALFVAPAWATEFRTGKAVTIGADEVIDDDLMAAGNSVVVQGKVTGDVLAAGHTVRVTGPVGGSVMAAGQNVVVTGDVDGSARVAARSVTLGGVVKRNVQAAGQVVTISDTADIRKDVHVGSNTFDLDGTVGRLLGIAAQNAALRGNVGGDLTFEGDALSLGPAAKVGGKLAYRSKDEPQIAQGAAVAGGVVKLPPRPGAERKRRFSWTGFVLRLLMWFAFGAVGLAIAPRIFRAAANAVALRPWWNLLLGLLVLTVVGIPPGAVALIAWLVALMFSSVPVSIYLGGRLLGSASPYLALFLGLLVLAVIGLIPIIGGVVKFLVILIGLAVYARATKGLIVEMRLQRA